MVVGIIAVLVAIAVPIFTGSLDEAKAAVEDANLRAAKAEAMVDYLEKAYTNSPASSGEVTLIEGDASVTYTWTYDGTNDEISVAKKTS